MGNQGGCLSRRDQTWQVYGAETPSSLAFISDLVPESASQAAEAGEDRQPGGSVAAERGGPGPAHKPGRSREWLRHPGGGAGGGAVIWEESHPDRKVKKHLLRV